ncbi:MAG: hypothetical protein M1829_001963 [Trizodia sp. TS-e1964]|nr:MAG: hypothetical protein M1829_001963 [Trizodia sp. TS-e1964]
MIAANKTDKVVPFRELLKTVIAVKVGPARTEFIIHKELACHHSPFFKAACMGNFKESVKKVILMENEELEIFKFLVQWLYKNSLTSEDEKWGFSSWGTLIRLYVLADKLGILLLKNEIINECVNKKYTPTILDKKMPCAGFGFSDPAIQFLVDHTLPKDPLAQFIADFAGNDVSQKHIEEEGNQLPKEILVLALASAVWFRSAWHKL